MIRLSRNKQFIDHSYFIRPAERSSRRLILAAIKSVRDSHADLSISIESSSRDTELQLKDTGGGRGGEGGEEQERPGVPRAQARKKRGARPLRRTAR